LCEAAVRLDALARNGFNPQRTGAALGISRQTVNNWYAKTLRLRKPLLPPDEQRAIIVSPSSRPRGAT
jgi:transposase-like protein